VFLVQGQLHLWRFGDLLVLLWLCGPLGMFATATVSFSIPRPLSPFGRLPVASECLGSCPSLLSFPVSVSSVLRLFHACLVVGCSLDTIPLPAPIRSSFIHRALFKRLGVGNRCSLTVSARAPSSRVSMICGLGSFIGGLFKWPMLRGECTGDPGFWNKDCTHECRATSEYYAPG
jgi:hypothetical protein